MHMALINCEECNKEISDKATHCVHCGCPVVSQEEEVPNYRKPLLPDNIETLGFKKEGLASHLEFPCHIVITNPDNTVSAPKSVKLSLYQRGFTVGDLRVNYNQVVNWKITDSESIMESDKSPLLRAALGGVLLGGVGAIVGGFSGLSKKQSSYDKLLSVVIYKPSSDSFISYHIAYNFKKSHQTVLDFFNEIDKAKKHIKAPQNQKPSKAVLAARYLLKKLKML
ncbi:MAG: hypothetical protein GYB16_08770 [Gammaproteobacteria bacterium]|nr:hypothetical protein [Gammaproteobacteria bacterium]